MTRALLVFNTGSSSVKFQLFRLTDGRPERHIKGLLDGMNGNAHLKVTDASGKTLANRKLSAPDLDTEAAVEQVFDVVMGEVERDDLVGVGHRVVHGGRTFDGPVLVDQASLAAIEALVPLAPLHQPANIAPIRAIQRRWPDLPQVASFDTVYHIGHAELIDRLAIPADLDAKGIRRYGFHGLSYAYVADRLASLEPALASGRMVVAHLGSGASLCAIQDGRSVETTMGFTAIDGVPMGTRPGRLDPGVVLYLLQQGWDATRIENLLYHDCGLLALSGLSSDVRELEASSDDRAAFALDYFAHRIAQATASLATTMGGIDGFVFTAGIGERSPSVRAKVADYLAWLGMKLDPAANGNGAETISAEDSRIVVKIIATDEEATIAKETMSVLRSIEH